MIVDRDMTRKALFPQTLETDGQKSRLARLPTVVDLRT